MSETKHTPGPWSVYDQRHLFTNHEGSARLIAGNIWIACVHGSHVGPQSKEEADANISLIAAAPELLEALESLIANVYSCACTMPTKEEREAWDKADAAIAKAEGEQP